jgi:hypothetical protein
MSLLSETNIFVAGEQRLDGIGTKWYPKPYVRLSLDGARFNLSPAVARKLAKGLTAYARLIDPPKTKK